ncbi:unnamed protein product [Adineta steineri]|uniref:Uncharacterized protein n=1 Tax=Adineta steineri TaxID=433720 RepID=A0A814SJL7_9BILA|nr:unnamed protein product [Adineta steineri]CAF1148762.1 unnamed protein product [Adineta steineri]CAF3629485.1 unnamed protein product [Adineta steineri]CAF3681028.1 unnamed protein product [Adineta steineri]
MSQQSYSFLCLRYVLVWLCISMVIIQLTQALSDDVFVSSSEDNTNHQLDRRSSKKVAQMLQQILQRGEMQVQPQRIHAFLNQLHRRETND